MKSQNLVYEIFCFWSNKKIKETEIKLDKLVNAFLDGSIEKEIYLAKKDELIKTKTDFNKRKSDFGRVGRAMPTGRQASKPTARKI